MNGPGRLFHNISGNGTHWLAVKLRGVKSNRQGLGATIRVVLPDGRSLFNHVTTAVGYGSSSEAVARFGLGANRGVDRIEIHLPSGATHVVLNVPAARIIQVAE